MTQKEDKTQNQGTKEAEEEVKPIDKWDGNAVKNRLDDAAKSYFTETLEYRENFILIDIRLGISLTAVLLAGWGLVWDHLHPFPKSRDVLMFCVGSYFVLMGILTFYTLKIEKGIFLKAKKDDKSIVVSSNMKRFDDLYELDLEQTVGKIKSSASLKASVSKWFDEKGYFLEDRFDNDLSKAISQLKNSKKDK